MHVSGDAKHPLHEKAGRESLSSQTRHLVDEPSLRAVVYGMLRAGRQGNKQLMMTEPRKSLPFFGVNVVRGQGRLSTLRLLCNLTNLLSISKSVHMDGNTCRQASSLARAILLVPVCTLMSSRNIVV